MQRPKTTNDEVVDLKRQITKELATPASSSRSSVSSQIESSRSRGDSGAISSTPSSLEAGRGSGNLFKRAGTMLASRVSRSSSSAKSEQESDFDRNSRLMGECDKVLSRVINAKDISERDRVMCLNDLKELYEKLTQISAQTNKLDKMSSAKASKLEQISEPDSKSDAEKLESQSRAAVKTIASVIAKSESAMRAESKKPAPVERSDSSEELVMPDSGHADDLIFDITKPEDMNISTRLIAIAEEIKTKPDAETVRNFISTIGQIIKSKEADARQVYEVTRKLGDYAFPAFKGDAILRGKLNELFGEIRKMNEADTSLKSSADKPNSSMNSSALILNKMDVPVSDVKAAVNASKAKPPVQAAKPPSPEPNQQEVANSNIPAARKPLPQKPTARNNNAAAPVPPPAAEKQEAVNDRQAEGKKPLPTPPRPK